MDRILIVDDSVDFAKFLEELLKREGYDTVVAHNGNEAIKYFDESHSFDLVITDVIMPEMDGMGLVNHLDAGGIVLPIIVISGGGVTLKSEEALKFFESRAAAVFSKPLDYQKFLRTLAELLQRGE